MAKGTEQGLRWAERVPGLVVETVVRSGLHPLLMGSLDGEPVVVKLTQPLVPWLDPRSPFAGGRGIVAPFAPLPLHEARAWEAADPSRVLARGGDETGWWLVLRRLPGAPLAGTVDGGALLHQLAARLHRLHGADVLHQDIRPANVLWGPEGARLIDLDIARVAGVGPAGALGSREWTAPELRQGLGDARADLYAVGRVVQAHGGPLGAAEEELVAALCAPHPVDRPASAAAVLRALGTDCADAPPLSPPHAALPAWWAGGWADAALTQGSPWQVVAQADRDGLSRWGLAGVASRLLAAAPQGGREHALALGALCVLLARAGGTEVDLHQAQAQEAAALAEAPWHPGVQAIARLHEAKSAADRVEALVALQLPLAALEEARGSRKASLVALAALRAGEGRVVDQALAAARPPDDRAVAVAASRLVRAAPDRVELRFVERAPPDVAHGAVRAMAGEGRLDRAHALAGAMRPPHRERALLFLALKEADLHAAMPLARRLAASGAWDPTVAAVVLLDRDAPADLRTEAAPIVVESRRTVTPRGGSVFDLLGRGSSTGPAWALVAQGLAGVGDWTRAGELLAFAENAVPWRVVVLSLLQQGLHESAELVVARARERFPEDFELRLLVACVALARGALDAAADAAQALLFDEPGRAEPYLLLSLIEAARGDRATARQLLATARSLAPGLAGLDEAEAVLASR